MPARQMDADENADENQNKIWYQKKENASARAGAFFVGNAN